MVPLKRLRTQLSIPLGLRHEGSTRAKRSLWWRKKRFVPVEFGRQSTLYNNSCRVFPVQSSLVRMNSRKAPETPWHNLNHHIQDISSSFLQSTTRAPCFLTSQDIQVVTKSRREEQNIRFFTIGTCFFARAIFKSKY